MNAIEKKLIPDISTKLTPDISTATAFLPSAFRRNGEGTVFTGICLLTGGYPHLPTGGGGSHSALWGEGIPSSLMEGTPIQPNGGVPHSPRPGLDGVPPPPPARTGWGYPPEGTVDEYLIRGGQYASCVHAGGLSCLNYISEVSLACSFDNSFRPGAGSHVTVQLSATHSLG